MGAWMVLPWIAPWSPSPQANTVPLLVSWACIGLLLVWGQRIQPLDIARAWVVAALISSVMGLIQYFGAASAFSAWLHVPGLGEANANLRQRNQLATLLGIGILALLWWQAYGLKTLHALWMLALLAIGNAATTSRTGLLHMLLVCGLIIFWAWRSRLQTSKLSPRLAFWALAVYLLANWALPWGLSVLSGQDVIDALTRMGHNEGCSSRRVLWANVLTLISQQPWTGWGWGELKYAHYITAYGGGPEKRFCEILGNAHNLPLHLAVTLGVPLAIALGLGLLAALAWARPWLSRVPAHQLAWSVLAVIGLHSLLEFPLWYGPFQMAVLLCGVLLLAPASGFKAVPSRGLQLAGGLILTIVFLVGADYARARQIYMPAAQRWPVWRDDPLGTAHSSWFFKRSAVFAELTMTRITPENAPWVLATSQEMLHYSPEPQVVRQLILSAHRLGRQDLVDLHSARWRAAFPAEPLPTR
ncbi:PglL family O-oligosaccharyltransferase [Limnohabitans sp. Rim47]|uniref:PglL family O-oligosaccharyltransferase n=2 Tax=Limnohabitans sp. Rim47 TaxID=1100721 RepID=UPI0002E4F569|nr:O-antigen ligase family protein [Limnohabitans sp. Rim47]